jgi:peptidoglycan hydrolase-like protein with peptidoglycan-binding domain
LALAAAFGAVFAAAMSTPLTPVVAQQPPTGAAQADPHFAAAQAAFDALPEADRKAIQDALVWTGDYAGTLDGGFGRRTFEAIMAHQRRARAAPDGLLDAKARAALIAAGERQKSARRFTTAPDKRTGVIIGVPLDLMVLTGPAPGAGGGTRWQTADEKATLDTRTYRTGETDLRALYDRMTAVTTPGRRITYKVLRDDFFVVSGETQTGKFFSRYGTGADGLRGFSLGYDKALAPEFDKLTVAIANSFVPFPAPGQPVPAARPEPQAGAPAARPAVASGPAATGIVLAPGRVLTVAAGACAEPRIGGRPARAVHSAPGGPAILEISGGAAPAALALADAMPADGEPVLVLAQARSFGVTGLAAAPGEVRGGRVFAPLQPGAAGAPVLDRAGRLVGLIADYPAGALMVAGIVPARSYAMIPASALAAHVPGVAPTGETGAGALAARLGPALVAIECPR